MKGLPLPITGMGEETRDFTYFEDIVDGLLRAGVMEGAVGQEFNLASGKDTRIIDLARMVNEFTGNHAGIRCVPRRKWDTKNRLQAAIDKAHNVIGYEPRTPFDVGLKGTLEWIRRHWDKIEGAARFGPGASSAVREMTSPKE